MKPLASILVAAALLFGGAFYVYWTTCGDCDPGRGTDTLPVPPGNFDYLVLSLSWSPSYCATEATERDRLQCGGKPFGFIVHGLWPQTERERLEDCPTDAPRVPNALIDRMLDIMPARGLIGHEWRSHGSCTGLSQEEYFALLRAAFERVTIPPSLSTPGAEASTSPDAVARQFLDANQAGMSTGDLVVTCTDGTLDEVRLCLTKDLRFRACGAAVKNSMCRAKQIRVPPVRGS